MSDFEPVVVVFACDYCAYTAADVAGRMNLEYPAGIRIVRVPCTGKVDSLYVLRALEKGADGVLVAGCLDGDCHFKNGNLRAAARVKALKRLLDEINIGSGRVEMVQMSAGQGAVFAETARNFVATVQELGPNPIKHAASQAA
ncbi:MAG: hydrogenase iron-sulfur subunit [Desulfarculaceae bacterium]|nr:hydrogenase iron-sulfur subunit [Desulfarculaceae bacterium]MCF8071468.1 hydrogenase iron-sulfur subunit [Desulfarculaceae bacterium]MCF8103404.1 hydrogenase iron-sulfur subunit [Desulfarculaceae bacterium]MCF8118064.1 hydrogenase iron-sulfur subunit [Desulfarculaceae bacterium]